MTVKDNWDEGAIAWNKASLTVDNISCTWVVPVEVFPNNPDILFRWNVSQVFAEAYHFGCTLRLVLYSANADIHSCKYFYSSNTPEWNAQGFPTLEVVWVEP